jgi:hypothetical protein
MPQTKIQQTFYWSVMLQLLVLRYSRNDCSFFKIGGKQAAEVRNIEEMLEKPEWQLESAIVKRHTSSMKP